MKNEENIEENNKLDEKDIEIENEKEMTRRTPLKRRTRGEQKAYFAKGERKVREYRKTDDYEPTSGKYNPNKSFPKKLKIHVPDSSPTLNMKDVDTAIDSAFEKKKKKG